MLKSSLSLRSLADLTKFGIIIFVVLCTGVGYALSYHIEQEFSLLHFLASILGTSILSAGSFALNQIQEIHIDKLMPRTQKRPLVKGTISIVTAWWVALWGLSLGLVLLAYVSPLSAALGLATVLLYNGFYTMYWKPKMVFGAVPGAIPGAMPVVIGFSANSTQIFSTECLYAFLIMFLWQMPHYWSLAIKFKEDYAVASVPTLPVTVGRERAVFHIGLYTFVYVGLALLSPWFVDAHYLYIFLVVPFALKVLWEFFKYQKAGAQQNWLPFFMWTNVSMIVFLVAVVVDKWHIVIQNINS